LFTQAFVIAQKIGHKRSECINLGGLGNVWYAQRRYQRAIDLFTRALNLAREIGAKHIEGIYIGNLGDAFAWLQRLEEAEGAFREAIPICEDTFPVGAGAFRGSLALLLAQQDQLEEAQALLQTGETQVEPHKEEHAKFLGKKGQVCHLAGDADGARTSLEQARALAVELKVTDESEIGQAIQALEAVLSEG
jgi:tetratricopeptide (TPR) repeat protein